MAELVFENGVNAAANYVRVGHNTSAENDDAVWSFTLDRGAKEVEFVLKWNNTDAGTGWSGSYQYVFAISENGASGQTAETGTHIAKQLVTLSGAADTTKITFDGLNLEAGKKYYLRANMNGRTTSTMKAFYKNGNTVTIVLAIGGITIKVNGEWKHGTPYVKIGGVWKQGTAYVKSGGSWKVGL